MLELTLSQLKQMDDALKWCSNTLQLDENNLVALASRAEIKLEQEEYDDGEWFPIYLVSFLC
jgi:hypothetical protein